MLPEISIADTVIEAGFAMKGEVDSISQVIDASAVPNDKKKEWAK
jgi:predicted CopG family antitoxin